jgi:hypothetical protein
VRAWLARKCTGVHNENCDTCPKITKELLNTINRNLCKLYELVDDYLTTNGYEYTLCRGTMLAALYYGQMVYHNSSGFKHWVDCDSDMVVFVHGKKEGDKIHKIHLDLSKMLKVDCYMRSNNDICMFEVHGTYDPIDLKACKTVHPIQVKNGRVLKHIGVDMAILYVEDGIVKINDTQMYEQTGIPIGEYNWSELRPVKDIGLRFYNRKILVPNKWWNLLRVMADNYKGGDYRKLTYPWFPGIETQGAVNCSNYKVDNGWFVYYKSMLLMNNSKMLLLNSIQKFDKFETRKPTIAIVFAGSEGDFVPLRAWLEVVEEFSVVTIYRPADVNVSKDHEQITYVDTYKNLVHGSKTDLSFVRGLIQRLKNVKGCTIM